MRQSLLPKVMAASQLASAANAAALFPRLEDTNVGLTPHMGWSSWNVAQCDAASEKYALETAQKFSELGLKDLGYTYVNIDDCWTTKERDGNGNLVPDPDKWPRGMRAVADELHEQGLKFGLYGCAGSKTCASYPGSEGHELQDMQQIAEWDVDFWKHDNCFTECPETPFPQTCWNYPVETEPWYAKMGEVIQQVKPQKEILFNLCQWGRNDVWNWGDKYGHSWRIADDNWGDWVSVIRIGATANEIAQFAGPGGFNDLDMLFVGNEKLTHVQERLHFGLWAIAKSPLVIGADLTKIPQESLDILKNKAIIDINQDPLGIAAGAFVPPGTGAIESGKIHPYWSGKLSDGFVVAFTGASGGGSFSVDFKDVPGMEDAEYKWQELHSGEEGSGRTLAFDVEQDDIAIFKVTS